MLKKAVYGLGLAGVLCASGVFANPQFACNAPTWTSDDDVGGSNFRFTVNMSCTAKSTKTSVGEAVKAQLEKLLKSTQKVNTSATNQPYNGLVGDKYNAVQSIVSDQGSMNVTSDIYLVGNSDRVFYNAKSTKIDITQSGNIKYTQSVGLDVDVSRIDSQTPGTSLVTIKVTKSVDISKPRFAPKGIFVSKAKEGVEKDLRHLITERTTNLGQVL